MTSSNIIYKQAKSDQDFAQGEKLFKEYIASLGVDLSFQDVDNELKTIDLQYNKPWGALILAMSGDTAIGCSGIRKLEPQTAELKRMYVQYGYRNLGIGVLLLEQSLQLAKELGYETIRLDTLKTMTRAKELYASFGFYEIPSYRYNPLEGTIYMEKKL